MSEKQKDANIIFLEAIEKPSAKERKAYLDEACRDDPGLREELESLLEAHENAGGFLKSPLLGLDVTLDTSPIAEGPGTVIGRYKLLEKIGEGGMAVVYMAEQERPLRRRVALKIIKLGMDTKQVIARFEAERQALAMMDHPNIAKVLDAGATETGRPYFVMELVRGVSITDYCDKNDANTRERLELFITVCNAVQHAHQKGIIHRDIKPSNVMITLDAGEPLVKVIDFGIAKATNRQLTEKTLFTRYAQMIGTPAYMSPEQAEMSALDIDTRTDIYSLGVLLYELLTGTTPFDAEKLNQAGYGEIQRIIREEEPLRPSTKLSTMGEELTDIAKRRHSSPELLTKLIRGDLDWIAMKSLEKNRNRRYDSAAELAADVQRHLNHEPVQAAAPSLLYKAQKFVRRNRVLVTTIVTVAFSIVLGLITTTVMYLRSEKMYVRSETMRVKAEEAGEKEADARVKAQQAESIAQKQRNEARRSLYCAHMLVARQDWEDGRVGRLWELLDAHRPKHGEQDFRGWEWYYLQSLLNRDLFTLRGHTGAVNSVAWSPDRRYIASGSDDHTIRIWDAIAGKPISVLRGHRLRVNSVEWGPDGKRLASASDDETVKVWDWATEEVVHTLSGHKQAVHSVTWSPDGKRLASGGEDSTVRIWDAVTGEEALCLYSELSKEPVLSVAWSPNARWVAAGRGGGPGDHGSVTLWNLSTSEHRQLRDYEGHGSVNSVAWSPDSRLVASATDHLRVKVWDGATGNKMSVLRGHKSKVISVAWSPDSQSIASAGEDQTVNIWDQETEEVLCALCGHSGVVNSVAWSPNGRRLATGSEDGTLKIWDATQTEEALVTRRHPNWVGSVSWSPDGQRLASAHLLPTFGIWDPLTGEELHTFSGHTARIGCVAWSPDNKRLATGSMDKTVRIWDAAGGPALLILKGHKGRVRSVAWSPDGKNLVSTGSSSDVIMWNATTGELISTLQSNLWSVKWSPDGGQIAASGKDGTIWIWDVNTSTVVTTFPGQTAAVNSLAWSPDGGRLARGSDDGKVAVWEVSNGREVFSVQGHTGWARSVVWSPDGGRLASGGGDGTIKIRDAATGEEVLTIRGHEAHVVSVAWSPDGRRLASGSFDNTAKVWDASIGYEMENDPNSAAHRVAYVRRRLARVWTVRGIARDHENKCNEAINDYESAIGADPSYARAYNALAWLLATCPTVEVRNGAKAVENATKACELTNWKNTDYLETLAASYAEAGNFDEAIKWQQKAMDLLGKEERSRDQLSFKTKMGLYQAGQSYHRPLSANQMIACWKFDEIKGETIIDSSSNGLHGELMGDAQIISDPVRGNVLSLDGDGDYVDCGNEWALDITDEITVAAWINAATWTEESWDGSIVSKDDWQYEPAGYVLRCGANGRLSFCLAIVGEWPDNPEWLEVTSDPNSMVTGKWYHVAGAYNGNSIRVFINGRLLASKLLTGKIYQSSFGLNVGRATFARNRLFHGLIDDVRIYNYALSEAEVKELYAGRGPGQNEKPE